MKESDLVNTDLIELANYDIAKLTKAVSYGNLTVAKPLAIGVINRLQWFFAQNGVSLK